MLSKVSGTWAGEAIRFAGRANTSSVAEPPARGGIGLCDEDPEFQSRCVVPGTRFVPVTVSVAFGVPGARGDGEIVPICGVGRTVKGYGPMGWATPVSGTGGTMVIE